MADDIEEKRKAILHRINRLEKESKERTRKKQISEIVEKIEGRLN